MFQRLANGWGLAKQSWRVLMLDKELLVFPFLSGICCLLVLGSFAVPLWNSEYAAVLQEDHQTLDDPVAYVILFAFYFANYFVIVFFNSALVACAIIRFNDGNPTLGDGLRAASSRLPQILAWALVSATVGVILRAIESKSERVGRFVAGLLGMAWGIATFFVVPVLVVEKLGPVDAFKRSLAILRKSWGEALAANFGIGFISFLASLVAMIPLIAGVVGFAAGNVALGILGISTGIVLLLLIALVTSALNAIVLGALYLYASEHRVPSQFDERLLENAFTRK